VPPISQLNISFVQSIEQIAPDDWDACAGHNNPFTRHAFLLALEASGSVGEDTGWQPYHMVIHQETEAQGAARELVACMPLYLKSHSYGEYVFDHGWADAYERAGGKYYPKLQCSLPFTPAAGPRLLTHNGLLPEQRDHLRSALLDGLNTITEQLNLSSAHVTFMNEAEAADAKAAGYLVRHDQQFHWRNYNYQTFEDFLSSLASRKRKQIRKERKTVSQTDILIETITGADIKEHHWDAFFEFYIDTGARKWGQPYLTRSFFTEIGKTMANNVVLFMCSRNGRYIAGALNFVGKDTLYGRQWGCIEDHPCLHFETCYYQAIDYAITHKLQYVEAGAQGAHKLARGYEPVRTYSAHHIPNPSFKHAVAQFLEHERRGIANEIDYLASKLPFKKTDN
jgi:predicted N-acyltransferase